jgi:hypothetical protein
MQVDIRSLVADFRREYGSGGAALRALGVKPVRVRGGVMAFDEAPPESAFEWLRKKGVAQDVVDEFRRRCEEGAEDEEEEAEEGNEGERTSLFSNTKVGDHLSQIDKFIRGKLHGDDLELHRNMIGALLNEAGGGASDAIPSRGRNGMPRNALGGGGAMDASLDSDLARRAAAYRHAQNCDPTLGGGTSGYGVPTDRVRFPRERTANKGAERYAPGLAHIKLGAI